jgi:hypothetical protein
MLNKCEGMFTKLIDGLTEVYTVVYRVSSQCGKFVETRKES